MTVTRITTAPRRRRPWGRLRGTGAVAVLLISALDHLVSAITGLRPLAVTIRQFAAPIAAAWRSAAWRTASPATVTIRTMPADERTNDRATDA
jgi:hypothetical protein